MSVGREFFITSRAPCTTHFAALSDLGKKRLPAEWARCHLLQSSHRNVGKQATAAERRKAQGGRKDGARCDPPVLQTLRLCVLKCRRGASSRGLYGASGLENGAGCDGRRSSTPSPDSPQLWRPARCFHVFRRVLQGGWHGSSRPRWPPLSEVATNCLVRVFAKNADKQFRYSQRQNTNQQITCEQSIRQAIGFAIAACSQFSKHNFARVLFACCPLAYLLV